MRRSRHRFLTALTGAARLEIPARFLGLPRFRNRFCDLRHPPVSTEPKVEGLQQEVALRLAGMFFAMVFVVGCERPISLAGPGEPAVTQPATRTAADRVVKTEAEWRRILEPEAYRILRQKGTERAFTGKYHDTHDEGVFRCAGCDNRLFSSEQKFDSGTGWPSFWAPMAPERIETAQDNSFGIRTEVLCARCGGHLGHVFDDGPKPTGLRYCINSGALKFERAKD